MIFIDILDFGWTCSEIESAITISRLSRSTHFSFFWGLLLKPRSHLSNLLYERGSETKLGSLVWGVEEAEKYGEPGYGEEEGGQFQDHGIMRWCITHRPLFVAFPIQ